MILLIAKWGWVALLVISIGFLLLKRYKKPGLVVLTYRKIGRPVGPGANKQEWTSACEIANTLDKLKKRGFTFISPHTASLSAKSVLLVFLDGYRSFYQEVYPLLKTRKIPCTVCISAGWTGQYNAWQNPYQEPWQDLLTYEEIHLLAKDPLVTLGAQPLNRQDVTQLSPNQAHYEIEEGIFRLEKLLGKQPPLFAVWPAAGPVRLRDLIPNQFRGWIWTNEQGLNPSLSSRLKTVWGNSWQARWLLWKMR